MGGDFGSGSGSGGYGPGSAAPATPAQQTAPQKEKETKAERRERLKRENAERVARNTYCSNLQLGAAEDAFYDAVGGTVVAGIIDRNLTLQGASKGLLTRGAIVWSAYTIFRDWIQGDKGDLRCQY
jgi:hypothetical protein